MKTTAVFHFGKQISRHPPIRRVNMGQKQRASLMTEDKKYTIFQTRWGYFGLSGSEKGVSRTCLPVTSHRQAKKALLGSPQTPIFDPKAFSALQERITAYFEGAYDDFGDVKVDLGQMTEFSRAILTACRKIKYAQTTSYSQLAKLANHPKATRAVGTALSRNPVPLITPCHRIITSTGKIGGFTAPGGIKQKEKMLLLEQHNPAS
jgi:methylated-DNA-[protein]-cysteine S-methyltransferase